MATGVASGSGSSGLGKARSVSKFQQQQSAFGFFLGTIAAGCLIPMASAQVQFVNEIEARGAQDFGWGRGTATVDLDNDGLLDIVNGNTGMDPGFFRQKSDGTFQRMNKIWQIPSNLRPVWGTLAFDCDKDGDVDIFMIAGGANVPAPNVFYRNDLDTSGVFTLASAGDFTDAEHTQNFGATVLDYDADGDLDIFLTTSLRDEDKPCILLRNDGDCNFVDVSEEAGITHTGDFRHAESADYNNDGYPDIMVARGDIGGGDRSTNVLYRNMGDGTFRNVAGPAGVSSPKRNFGVMFAYLDGDDKIDIVNGKYLLPPIPRDATTRVFLNHNLETFRDVTEGSGLNGRTDMGQIIAYFDGLNPYFYRGTGTPPWLDLDWLFKLESDGQGGIRATDISESSGIRVLGVTRAHGMGLGDYDRDGDLDIYVNNGGPDWQYEYQEANAFFFNQLNPETWLATKLIGVVANREAAGARMNLVTNGNIDVWRHQAVGTGFCNTNGPYHHFSGDDTVNLGTHRTLTIHWPQPSGITQTIFDPELNSFHDIVETGLLSVVVEGDSIRTTLCGPTGYRVDLFASDREGSRLAPEFGGMIGLGEPLLVDEGEIPDADAPGAVLEMLTPLPPPVLNGRVDTVFLQAWIRPHDGSTGTGSLSNVIRVDIER